MTKKTKKVSVKKPEVAISKAEEKKQKRLLSERKEFDPKATKEDCINDLRKIQKVNPEKFITRNFYRNHGKYSDSTWNRFFGTYSEFASQAKIRLSRQQHRMERQVAKHASIDHYKQFFKEEVLPYCEKHNLKFSNSRYKLVATISDLHDIETDDFILSTFIDACKRTQPDVIALNGDIFDCYDASKYPKDLRQFKIVERFDFVKERIFKALREACPKAQIDFILGNHEWRILHLLADKTPNFRVVLSDVMGLKLEDIFGVKDYKINLICKSNLGAFTKKDERDELRKNFRVYFDTFMVGHFMDLTAGMSGTSGHCHRPETITFTNLPMGKCFWVQTGCGCRTEAEYVEHRDKWTNSFLFTHIDTKKKIATPEHFIINGDSVVIHGKRYERK